MSNHSCPDCGETKRSQFWKDGRKGPKGLQTYCKVCAKVRRENWGKANPDKVRQYQKSADEKRPTRRKAMARHIYDQVTANNIRARERNKDALPISAREWEAKLKEYPNTCPGCNKLWVLVGAPTMDHIIPLSVGGKNNIRNIQPLCRSCNSRKGDRMTRMLAMGLNRVQILEKLANAETP